MAERHLPSYGLPMMNILRRVLRGEIAQREDLTRRPFGVVGPTGPSTERGVDTGGVAEFGNDAQWPAVIGSIPGTPLRGRAG